MCKLGDSQERRTPSVAYGESVMSIYRWLVGVAAAIALSTAAAAEDNQQKPAPLIAGNPAVAPLKWVGLLVFQNAKKQTFSCTAQFIAPKVLLTAAHCVRDNTTGEWYDTSKMFFLAVSE